MVKAAGGKRTGKTLQRLLRAARAVSAGEHAGQYSLRLWDLALLGESVEPLHGFVAGNERS
jgi:hypothetical protein